MAEAAPSTLPQGPPSLPVPAVALIVLDGWGLAPDGPGNAVSRARTPIFDELWAAYPHCELAAGGRAVGLPEGQMGNSEVGHMNLGAGAVVMQDLTRIDEAAAADGFASNQVLREAMSGAERVHLIGLVSDGGVHSGWQHLEALIHLAASLEVPDLVLHAFTDGRDTLPESGAGYLEAVEGWMTEAGAGRIASVVGRYFAMDRDRRWDRTQRAYDLMVHGQAPHRAASGPKAAHAAYQREETDEFIEPVLVGEEARIRPGDSVIAFNFRPDRMRQITRALAEPGFDEIDRGGASPVERYATMTQFEEDWDYPVAFPPERPSVTLPSVLASRGVRQLHVAETEKYAHVTYFFNGGIETPFAGEDRELVPSKKVATYDLAPEMSADGIGDIVERTLGDRAFDVMIVNFANADMVGHSGKMEPTVKAVEAVDAQLGRIYNAVRAAGASWIITADHGNAEMLIDPVTGGPHTAHTTNPVPLLLVTSDGKRVGVREGGSLRDIAPTMLGMLGLELPAEMTGGDLRVKP